MNLLVTLGNHVRAVAMVRKHPTSPGQGARTEPGIQVSLCGRCHLALPHPSHSTHMPVSHRGFSRCQSRPRQALVQHVPSSASPVPLAPFTCPFASWSCGNHCSGPWERGSGVESRRSVTSAVSAWLASQPRQLHFSTISPPLCSHTAPGISDCSWDQRLLLPARVPFPTARPVRVPACPAQVTPGSAIPVDAGVGERSCRAAPALTGPGVCYSWPCPVLKIAPALRKGAVSPVWVCSAPVGLEGGRVLRFPSSTAVPVQGLLQEPRTQQGRSRVGSTPGAWPGLGVCSCWHTGLAEPAGLGQGWGSGPAPRERGPWWHPHGGTAALLWVHLPSCGARCYATAGS